MHSFQKDIQEVLRTGKATLLEMETLESEPRAVILHPAAFEHSNDKVDALLLQTAQNREILDRVDSILQANNKDVETLNKHLLATINALKSDLDISLNKGLDLKRQLAKENEQKILAEQKTSEQATEIRLLTDRVNALQRLVDDNNSADTGANKYAKSVRDLMEEVGPIFEQKQEIWMLRGTITGLESEVDSLCNTNKTRKAENKFLEMLHQKDSERIEKMEEEMFLLRRQLAQAREEAHFGTH